MLERIIPIAVVLVCLSAIVPGQTNGGSEIPADYESDGCTLFPDGNYRDCCVAHDRDYYKGGSCKERRSSDNRLYRCIRNKKGWQNKVIAPIMWLGVRVAGVPFLPTPFRWGFGKKNMKKKETADPLPERRSVPADGDAAADTVRQAPTPTPTPSLPPVEPNK